MDVDTIQVDLFGTECNTDAPDADGNVWSVEEVAGWDGPDQRTSTTDPTALHGTIAAEMFASGRTLVITGEVRGTQASAWVAYNKLTSSMPGLMGSGDVVVYEPVPKALTVVQSRQPRLDPPMRGSVRFQLTVLAEYPWKRAVTAESAVTINAGATASFTESGNVAAEIVVTTTSSGTVELTAGGLTLSSTSVPSGTVFDSTDFTVTGPGGEDLFSALVPGYQWPAVVPGSNTFVSSGTANVALVRHKTYA